MTLRELLEEISDENPDRKVVISLGGFDAEVDTVELGEDSEGKPALILR